MCIRDRSSTALQADSGADQQVACPDGSFKTGTGSVSLLGELSTNPSDLTTASGTYAAVSVSTNGSGTGG